MPWTKKALDRFFAKVDRRGPDECWPWIGARMPKGYGRFRGPDGQGYAHRFAYEIENGVTLDPDQKVRHSCDNPPCCNPKHLLEGTQADNLADMRARGRARGNTRSGLQHHACVTTPDTERRIRQASHLSQRVLAERFGISRTAIRRVLGVR